MAYNFPNSPSNGDTVTVNNVTYTYNSTSGAWKTTATSGSGGSGGGASVTVSETAPASPTEGDLWFDPSVLKTFVYYNDGTANQWVQSNPTGGGGGASGGASVTVSETAPTSPSAGDLWWSSSEAVMYIYYTDTDSSQWVSTSTPGADGATGATGATGPAGADGGAGVASVYATVNDLPLIGNSQGDMAHVTANNTLYFWNGSGWYKIALINTSPSISGVNSSYDLASDGTATTITVTASDPEGLPITYSIASDTSGSIATVTQGTGASSNVFTVTPSTNIANGGTFSLTFRASDGVNIATAPASFTLVFATENSSYTSALFTTGSSLNNNSFIDSSTNSHTITAAGNATQVSFSPYRHGGYSTYFDGSDYMSIADNANLELGSSSFTVEAYFYQPSISGIQVILSKWAGSSYPFLFYTNNGTAYFAVNNSLYGSGGTIIANQWNHMAVTRNGNDWNLWLNGTSVYNTTNSLTVNDDGTAWNIGRNPDGGGVQYFTGYITDLRMVKGTSLYTSAFTPPTERLTAITNTTLLTCHLPYIADGSTYDHTITVAGNTKTEPFAPYNYQEYSSSSNGGSMYFDGASDYLTIPSNSAFTLDGDFTIEGWFYSDGAQVVNYPSIISSIGWTTTSFSVRYNHTGYNNRFFVAKYGISGSGGANSLFAGTISVPYNTWNHFALVRSGTTCSLYVNGKLDTTTTDSTDFDLNQGNAGTAVGGGNWDGAASSLKGNVSNLRVVKGTAVYTSDFTPPTAPLTAVTNTSLLLNGTNFSIYDKSQSYRKPLGYSGGVTVNTGQTKYLSSSVYFDGTDDRIFLYDLNYNWDEDWTIETWVRSTNTGGYNVVMGQWGNNSSRRFATGIYSGTWYFSHTKSNGSSVESRGSAVSTNTWYHMAVVKEGSTVKLYVDGTLDITVSSVSFNSTSFYNVIGGISSGGDWFSGYLSDFRITKGLARYTANFTPPAAALQG